MSCTKAFYSSLLTMCAKNAKHLNISSNLERDGAWRLGNNCRWCRNCCSHRSRESIKKFLLKVRPFTYYALAFKDLNLTATFIYFPENPARREKDLFVVSALVNTEKYNSQPLWEGISCFLSRKLF